MTNCNESKWSYRRERNKWNDAYIVKIPVGMHAPTQSTISYVVNDMNDESMPQLRQTGSNGE
jgi:hypothetical protein